MKVVIAGGSGLIGRALAESLSGDGHEVVVLTRSSQQANAPAGVRAVAWDGKTLAEWQREIDGADGVVNLAGYNLAGSNPLTMRWTKARRAKIMASRKDTGRVLAEAVAQAKKKPEVFVQFSAIGYYGPRGDEELDESADPADDFLAQVCVEWEKSSASVEALGVRRVVARTGIVLDNDNFAFFMLKLPVALFVGSPLGNGKQVISWIHMADQVGALRFLLETPAAQGIFNLTAPLPQSNRDFVKMLARVMRRPFIPVGVPGFLLRLPLGEVATVVLDGQRVLPARLLKAGYQFHYPELETALRDLLKK